MPVRLRLPGAGTITPPPGFSIETADTPMQPIRLLVPLLAGAVTAAVLMAAPDAGGGAPDGASLPAMIEPADEPAPAWSNDSWLNTDSAISLASLRGHAVLLNFWTYTCQACTNALPSLVDLDRAYREDGLTVLGIHTPEFPPYAGEHDRANVADAIARYGITYPVAQDNDRRTFELYDARYWPTYVLIDREGTIRFHGSGSLYLGGARHRWWARRIEELLGTGIENRESGIGNRG